jgi:hypothetical protein
MNQFRERSQKLQKKKASLTKKKLSRDGLCILKG